MRNVPPTATRRNKQKDLVSRFKSAYAEALVEAQVSAEHTATEGWKALYHNFNKDNRESRRKVSERLKNLSAMLEVNDIGELGEKEIGDAKKEAAELRVTREIFDRETVGPVREPVEKCQKVLSDMKRQARADYERAPLVNVGLIELMEMEIAKVKRAAWDAETGRVEIKPPPTDE